MVRDVIRVKDRIIMILMKNDREVPFSDLFGMQGPKYFEEIELPPYHRRQVEIYLAIYGKFKEKIEPLT